MGVEASQPDAARQQVCGRLLGWQQAQALHGHRSRRKPVSHIPCEFLVVFYQIHSYFCCHDDFVVIVACITLKRIQISNNC